MTGSPLVALVFGLLTIGRHLTVGNPFQEVVTEEEQLTECSGSPHTGVELVVPEEGCFYVDSSYNRRHVYVASPDEIMTASDECGISEDGSIIVPSGQDCLLEDNGAFIMFVNIVKGSGETAVESGSPPDYEQPEVVYGDV